MFSVTQVVFLATIIGEAENQTRVGMQLVAESIRNRTQLKKYSAGDHVSTCLWPYAYSTWNTKDPGKYRALVRLVKHETQPDVLVVAALAAMNKALSGSNLSNGATHYFSTDDPTIKKSQHHDADGVPCPDWVENLKPTTVEGSHRFYSGVA